MKLNRNILVFFICAIVLVVQPVHSQIFFEEQANALGINISGGSTVRLGGVSFFDYDNDGWDDLTFGTKDVDPVRFFKNNNGTFVEETFNININGHSKQVIWVDYDNDGDNDLFVARLDANNKLFQNDGNFNFTDVTASAGFSNAALISYGASFGDYDNDGFLDVFISNKDDDGIIPNQLYHNNGDGTFTDVSVAAGISTVGHLSFCSAFFDYDKDGYLDIYISNDRMNNPNIMYHNNGDGTFTDTSAATGTNIIANAMSTTIGDYNYDGWLDIYVTNTSEGNFLLKNNGDGTFTDMANYTGTLFHSIGWGAIFLDADNDMDLDMYVSGMINNPNIGVLTSAFYESVPGYIFQIPSNAGFANDNYRSFANAIGDVDNNGYPDFIVMNESPDNHTLWQNSGGTNNWLKVKLEGVISNKNGIGSWIEIMANGQVMYRYTLCGEGFLSQNSASEFFGLGTATTIDYIKVNWLSGVEDMYYNVNPNQTLTLVEGETLSTNEFSQANFHLTPNPTTGTIQVFNVTQPTKTVVYDVAGRLIDEMTLTSVNHTISLKAQAKGMYFVALEQGGRKVVKKVVLQ